MHDTPVTLPPQGDWVSSVAIQPREASLGTPRRAGAVQPPPPPASGCGQRARSNQNATDNGNASAA